MARMTIVHRRVAACLLLCWLWVWGVAGAQAAELRVGSKRFTESYILAQIMAQTVQASGTAVQVRQGLGNTIVYEALRSGQIDVYAEYTGTIAQEIVKDPSHTSLADLQLALAPLGLDVGVSLGFNDGYALAMRRAQAEQLGIRTLSDLARHPELRFGLSNEFLGRADGWQGLAARYQLRARPTGLDHGLAYGVLAQGQIDVMDIYTTDAKIDALGLLVLEDDRQYFPRYDAVLLFRKDFTASSLTPGPHCRRCKAALAKRRWSA
jgi:osmoprotectant transport system permease protein